MSQESRSNCGSVLWRLRDEQDGLVLPRTLRGQITGALNLGEIKATG